MQIKVVVAVAVVVVGLRFFILRFFHSQIFIQMLSFSDFLFAQPYSSLKGERRPPPPPFFGFPDFLHIQDKLVPKGPCKRTQQVTTLLGPTMLGAVGIC